MGTMTSLDRVVATGGEFGGCVIQQDDQVIAWQVGHTFSTEGLCMCATQVLTYRAYFPEGDDVSPLQVELRAVDVDAALMLLHKHYEGDFALYVVPNTVFIGEYTA